MFAILINNYYIKNVKNIGKKFAFTFILAIIILAISIYILNHFTKSLIISKAILAINYLNKFLNSYEYGGKFKTILYI